MFVRLCNSLSVNDHPSVDLYSFADYGCMLEIQNLDYLPDGRSLVETIGRRRFRVLQRGLLDGYHIAEIEYLVDKKLEGEELQEVQRLHDMVYQQLEECFSQQRGSLPRRIFMHHASPPPKDDDIQVSAGENECSSDLTVVKLSSPKAVWYNLVQT